MFVNGSHVPNRLSESYGQAKVTRSLMGGDITLDAGAGNDRIQVSKGADGKYHVNVNGQDFAFTAEEFKRLKIKGGDGNDRITVAGNVDLPIKIDGGAGSVRPCAVSAQAGLLGAGPSCGPARESVRARWWDCWRGVRRATPRRGARGRNPRESKRASRTSTRTRAPQRRASGLRLRRAT